MRFRKYLNISLFAVAVLISSPAATYADKKEHTHLERGNKLYNEEKFEDAEIEYRKAKEAQQASKMAKFNIGDALYKQGKYEEAASFFENLTNEKLDDNTKSAAFHNLGNSQLKQQKYEESIKSYKSALKLNPDDNEARYNLEYAKTKLIQQQQQQQQNEQNKDKNQEEKDKNQQDKQDQQQNQDNKNQNNKDKQDQQQNKDGKDKQDKNNKDKQNQDNKDNKDGDPKDQQQQQQNEQNKDSEDKKENQARKKNEISKQDAERMLKALENEEKKLQKNIKFEKRKKGEATNIEKKW